LNKKVQKGLVAAVAATMGASVVAPTVFAASQTQNVSLAAEYDAAYKATAKALESKDQKDITGARVLVENLYNIVKGTADERLATTLSTLLDPVQQDGFNAIIAIAEKTPVAEVKQAKINEAKYIFNNLPANWKTAFNAYSTAIDTVQQKYAVSILEQVKAANTVEELEAAKAKFEDLKKLNFDSETLKAYEDAIAPEIAKKEVVKVQTVNAVGAKKIEVKFNKAIDTTKATIEVKKGTVKPSVKAITFAEDKKSAVIEFNTNLAAGEYTVNVSGLTTETLTAKTTVEAEKLTKIEFLSDVAVISGNNVTTSVVAKNQYGEDVTAKLAATTVSATTSKGTSATVDNKGKLTVINSVAYTVGEKVVVTIVDSETGLVTTKTLTVAQAADVKSIELGELTTDNKDLVGKPINVTAMTDNATQYYLPITVKDQYGNVLKASQLVGVNVLSSNSNIMNLATTAIVDTDNGTVIKFQSAGASATYGTTVITVVSAGTGVTANTAIEVKENAKIDVVTIEAPATELKLNTPTALPVSVVDTYGKEIALKDLQMTASGNVLTLASGSTITATNATFSIVQDYVNNKAIVKITPTAKNVILTVATATGKTQNLTLTANAKPVVAGIKGINSDFVTMLANDTTLTTKLDDKVEFVDQYGEDIDAPAFGTSTTATHFTITEKDAANVVTTYSNGAITASTTAGTETYVVTLKNAAGEVLDTREVTVKVVDAAKITEFGINDLNKFYTKTTAAVTHTQDIDIHGIVDGKKVVVNQAMAKDFAASNGLTGINATSGVFTPADVNTDSKDVASTIRVLVEAGDNTYTITKDVVYSNAAPKAESLNVKLDNVAVTGAVQITPVAGDNIVSTGTDKLKVYAKDQYGKVITTGYNFVITNNTTNATIAIDNAGVIAITGTPASGKSFQINATIDGITKAIKVIIE
jgi:hypothetical protein